MLAEEVVNNPEEADIIVSDNINTVESEEQEIIHSYDLDKMLKLMNL